MIRITGNLHEHLSTLMGSRLIILGVINVSDKSCRENQNTYCISNDFFSRKSCLLWGNVEKYGTTRQATDDNTTQSVRFACWVTKVTDAHSEYVNVLLSHCNNSYVNDPQYYGIHYTWPVFNVNPHFQWRPSMSILSHNMWNACIQPKNTCARRHAHRHCDK